MTFQAALVGTGHIAEEKHFPAWTEGDAPADLVAVCDLDEDAAREAAQRHDIPAWYADVDTMLQEGDLDIVDVCTPPATHDKIGVQCLEAGAHLLVEKPMALDVGGCDRLIEAAEANDREVSVFHSDGPVENRVL